MTALRAGALLGRRYRLLDQIGIGGMSVIWRARDEVLDRLVAVKVLAASLAADAKFRDLVREEARAAAQLVHPHVTAVHDYGETVANDGAITAFVVMELLTGTELEARLDTGPLPWAEAIEVCAEVAEALTAAHRLGIVHRDVTPANIMLTSAGAKVLDFGIATHVGAPDEDEDGDTFGTPAYVAPERLDGRPAQPATDTYSLGVLLFETLTGEVPYPAATWDDLTEALRRDTPPLTGVPGLPPAVADICQRCLSRDPQQRPTARHVGEVLRAQLPIDPQVVTMLAPTVTLPVTGPVPAVDPAEPDAGPETGVADRPARVTGRSPLRLVAGAAVAAVALIAAVLLGLSLRPTTHRDAGPWGAAPGPGSSQDGRPGQPGDPSPGTLAVPPDSPPGGSTPAPTGAPTTGTPTTGAPTTGTPTTGPPTTGTPTTGPPTTGAPTTGTPTTGAPVSPTPSVPTVGQVAAHFDERLDDGLAAGAIRADVGQDLRHLAGQLRDADAGVGVAPLADQLRRKVADRLREGAITDQYADILDDAIDRISALG